MPASSAVLTCQNKSKLRGVVYILPICSKMIPTRFERLVTAEKFKGAILI
jgi:hypothetical protein